MTATTAAGAATGAVARARVLDVALRAQRQEDRAVREEQQQRGDAAEQRVGVEQREERAGEVVRGVQRHAVDDVRPADAPEQRGSTLPTTIAHSQRSRQASESDLPQNSNATLRTMSPTRIRNSAR